MAELYKADFGKYLGIVIPLCMFLIFIFISSVVLATMDSDEGIEIAPRNKNDIEHGEMAAGTDSEEEDLDDEDRLVQDTDIQEGFLDEKSSAIHALAQMAQQCGSVFFQFWDSLKDHIESLVDFPHHFIRQAVLSCYEGGHFQLFIYFILEVLISASSLYPMKQVHSKGVLGELSRECKDLINFVCDFSLNFYLL